MSALIPFNHSRSLPGYYNGFENLSNMLDDFFSDALPRKRNFNFDTFKLDVADAGNEYEIAAEMPGVSKDEISLNFDEEGKLTIAVKKEEESKGSEKNYLHRERRVTSMSRSLYLEDADSENVKAKLENGILNISVGKRDRKAKVTAINID